MTRGRRHAAALAAAWILATAALGTGSSWADPAPAESPSAAPRHFERADLELLDRMFAESDAVRRAPPASWAGYFTHLSEQVGRAVAGLLARSFGAVAGERTLWGWVARALVALALVALLVLLVRIALALPGRRRPAAEQAVVEAAGRPRADAARDAVAWRVELERRLAAGQVAAALEAAWWWLACSLVGLGVDPAWTGPELLERAGRRDLSPLLRRLDALAYGARRPSVEEVRRYAERLAEVLA
jgi:hypothetical protein